MSVAEDDDLRAGRARATWIAAVMLFLVVMALFWATRIRSQNIATHPDPVSSALLPVPTPATP